MLTFTFSHFLPPTFVSSHRLQALHPMHTAHLQPHLCTPVWASFIRGERRASKHRLSLIGWTSDDKGFPRSLNIQILGSPQPGPPFIRFACNHVCSFLLGSSVVEEPSSAVLSSLVPCFLLHLPIALISGWYINTQYSSLFLFLLHKFYCPSKLLSLTIR